MGRIIWDGEKIVVSVSKPNAFQVHELAEKYGGEYLPDIYMYSFDRNLSLIEELGKLPNMGMDESFRPLYKLMMEVKKKKEKEMTDLGLPENFYPFQKEAVRDMLHKNGNILLASDPGCGKTAMSIMYLKNAPNAYPALIITPASLKKTWEVEFNKWNPGLKIVIIEGRTSYNDRRVMEKVKNADVVIINYDILGIDDKEAVKREKQRIAEAKEKGWKYRKAFIPVGGWVTEFNDQIHFNTIVCDECQYIESSQAVRTRAVIQACKDIRTKKLFLSGTPFETKVRQFYNACHILCPQEFPSESQFLFTFCDPKQTYFGWKFDGVSNLEELRRKLSFFMIRHKKEDVLSQLPQKVKIPIYFEMDKTYREKYDEMEEQLASMEGLHQFTKLAEMKKVLAEIKGKVVVQYLKDLLEVEEKIVVFTQHTMMWDLIMDSFKGMAVGINGGVEANKRQKAVDKFQNDDKVRVFVGQVQAASTGLTLTAAHTLVFTEWANTAAQLEQASDRIHRIGQKADQVTIYYMIVKDTIDEDPLATLSAHYADVQAVMNGEENSQMVDYDKMMIAKVKERALLRKKKGVQITYQESIM
ncbi:MAG: DEAD/DEAH box helicase [Paludibacteraceae bacterium]|nr:DEAD/DEAH box helicase [Paludibacteraceae bacterium]